MRLSASSIIRPNGLPCAKNKGPEAQRAASIVAKPSFALYSVPMEPVTPPSKPDGDEVVNRRAFGAKLLYIPPAVLAVIEAAERPALAITVPM